LRRALHLNDGKTRITKYDKIITKSIDFSVKIGKHRPKNEISIPATDLECFVVYNQPAA
jgi:hypothetical protein